MTVWSDTMPVCQADITPVIPGTNNSVTCRLGYTRHTDSTPDTNMTSSVTWPNGASGNFRSFPADPHQTGTVSATVHDVVVTQEGIPAINWTAHFSFRVQSTQKDVALNSDSWSWTSNAIPVWSEYRLYNTSEQARIHRGLRADTPKNCALLPPKNLSNTI